jgi:hypothetical protein
MKNLLFFLTFFSTTLSFSQFFNCGTTYEPLTPPNGNNITTNNQSNADPNQKFVINVFFHLVRYSEGHPLYPTGPFGSTVGEEKILDAVKFLNINYNSHNIFFKYKGYDIIYNNLLNENAVINSSQFNGTGVAKCLNLYFVNIPGNGTAWATLGNSRSVFSYFSIEDHLEKVIVHEIAHCMNLRHIFQNAGSPDCEHVTRIPGPDFNADWAGDGVVDTPAQLASFNADSNCNYIYNAASVDCIGEPYVNIIPSNYMSYDNNPNCPNHFTEGQMELMRNYLVSPTSLLTSQNIFNTVESLYKPFDSDNITTNIISTTDNNDGTLKVCRNYYSGNFRFQPGFDYIFPENTGSDPVTATVNQTPLVVNPPFNCPLIIQQLSPSYIGQAETVCRGVVCVDEPFVSGIKYSSEVLGAMNVTVEYLNEIQVKDPNLYETLMSQYYHILKKYTASGASIEKVIYKN